jgi:hypothetical protein
LGYLAAVEDALLQETVDVVVILVALRVLGSQRLDHLVNQGSDWCVVA